MDRLNLTRHAAGARSSDGLAPDVVLWETKQA